MSESSLLGTKSDLIRYTMNTQKRLSARECERYLMAAIDELSIGCLAAEMAQGKFDPNGVPSYRNRVGIVRISYENPWEIIAEVIGGAAAVMGAIESIILLRSKRRNLDALSGKLEAESAKIEAETESVKSRNERERRADEEKLYLLERQREREAASQSISGEVQDRRTKEKLAELVRSDDQPRTELWRAAYGLDQMRDDLAADILNSARELQVKFPDEAGEDIRGESLVELMRPTKLIADNARLLASYNRLDELRRTIDIIEGDDYRTNPSSH